MWLAKPDGCSQCPLYSKGQGFCPDAIAKHPKYRFIAEAPGKTEIQHSKDSPAAPFKGKAGFVLKSWLMRAIPQLQLADERGEVSYANVLRCLPPEIQGRPYPKGEEKTRAEALCRQYDTPMDGVETVVLFGEMSQRLFFREELEMEDVTDRKLGRDVKGVSGRMGRVYRKDGRVWVFAPHPAWILRQPSLVEHGQQVLKIAAGVDREVVVDYMGWDQAMEAIC